ncbi:hypothetical protein F4556_006411 [Kitasatospora gansuensis]|uniref:Uncharacterized protein n=1 Tax=Kitasatospora gansuensis TaxID=258050 RepID=A0A7W7SK97_9ACTN|nr:hypothetical protein [Kitasatospora gansuensis]MBB4950876.1 hypothetical protein [Kitasatospora gansuensis]
MPELDEYGDDQTELIVKKVGGATEEDSAADGQEEADQQVQTRSSMMEQGQS